ARDGLERVVAADRDRAEQRAPRGDDLERRHLGHRLEDGLAAVELGALVLREVRERDVVPELALALARRAAGEDAHERALAGAVRPDQRQAVAALDEQVETAEHDLVAVGFAHLLELEDAAAAPRRLGE